ncbi:hypothetical protein BDZ94DRAFT_220383 [Collybia nuda]|uniref:PIN domain-containing protein n=1 Tax=Collybia nuda TaxID=64659 RepID=A0A9P5YCS8_9AGAR|nr:hypothetical protein BDZ94DRAFT_220383 [Collybia nuda]
MPDTLHKQQPRKSTHKDRDSTTHHRELQPTDLDARLTALRRRTEGAKPTRDRPPPPPPPPARSPRPPPALPSPARPSQTSPRRHHTPAEADHDDFSRRLKISSSPSPAPPSKSSKLFNPVTDPIPVRRTAEPEVMSDATGSSHVRPTPSPALRDSHARQLFDHRKDDPVRFSVLARPPRDLPKPISKSSNDYVSASSTSSYANSVSSSAFTLSSTTDGSSASSALFDRHGGGGRGDDGGNNVFSVQLKKLYRAITSLETKVKMEDVEDRDADEASVSGITVNTRVTLKGKENAEVVKSTEEELEREKWKNQIADHKQLAEIIHNLLEISLAPSVPASLRNIPTKYNIIVRLWTYAFHKLLESLRRASFTSPLALEHLQDFIYYAYTFYTGLLEEPTLSGFKSGWLEALGDLARYRMAVAAMVGGSTSGPANAAKKALTVKAVHDAVADQNGEEAKPTGEKSISDKAAARIDDSPSPSVGIAAARLLDVEPETERWRGIARDWYGAGLTEQPGTGKLHHHLGLLCREVEGEELRGIYHFVKSMTTLHPFPTSRESILPLWSSPAQARRAQPDSTRVPDLFVLLQGMLFTHIQLDDFQPTLARFIERLELEGAEEREWIMMAIVNIGAIYEYGRPGGVLRRVGGKEGGVGAEAAAMKVMMAKKMMGVNGGEDEKMDVDGQHSQASPTTSDAGDSQMPREEAEDHPPAFKYSLQLTFAMLEHVLRRPTRKASPYARSSLNPYLSIMLTFLATVLRHSPTLVVMERSIPWDELAIFFGRVPRGVMSGQGLLASAEGGKGIVKEGERWVMLTSGCAPALPEDWCLRGMEWVGRKVFERGYWKSGEERRAEIEVLEESEGGEVTDGRIENDDEEGEGGRGDIYKKRWVRIVRSAVGISGAVDGLTWVEGTREWRVEGKLAEKVRRWRDEDQIAREAEERRRLGTRWADDSMDVDEENNSDVLSEEDEDDENDTEQVKALKARRRYLQSLLQSSNGSPISTSPTHPRPRERKQGDNRSPLPVVPGYTVLIVDTNILLSSLSMFASIVESMRWTVVVPLPVIMELDGLSSNPEPQLSEAAQGAMSYISSHIRSHTVSLKVQTSKGNYLSTLSVRAEQVDFEAGGNMERSMDDLILKAAIWQDEHWVDRSGMLKANAQEQIAAPVKVVLLSLDRNLRLKARSRQLPAASEKDLASILANAT